MTAATLSVKGHDLIKLLLHSRVEHVQEYSMHIYNITPIIEINYN